MVRYSKLFAVMFFSLFLVGVAVAAEPTYMDLLTAGRADDAIRSLTQKTDSNAATAQDYNLLCRVYFSLEDWDNAVKYGERSVQLNPNVSSYYLWLARSYGEKADSVGALSAIGPARKSVAAFEKAVQLDPNDAGARHDLAEFYAIAPSIIGGGKDKARRLADEVATKDPVTAASIRAMVAARGGNDAEAERQYKLAISASGNSAQEWLEIANFYRRRKRFGEFENAVVQAMNSPKKRPQDLFDAGELLVAGGRNLPGAIRILESYIAGPTSDTGPVFRAHYLLGRAYQGLGNRESAIREYKAALALAKNYKPAQAALRRIGD